MDRIIPRLSAAERTAFIVAARSLLGTPFKHRGRSVRGVDCVGLVAYGLQAVGRSVEDRDAYGRDPVKDGLREVLRAHFGAPVTTPRAGDVALMRWHEAGGVQLVNHVGVLFDYPLGGLAMVHSLSANRAVIEHRLSAPWPRRIVEVYRP